MFSTADGWIESPHSGTWVKIYRDMKPWADARAVCQAEGADLVKILDDSMNEFIWGEDTLKAVKAPKGKSQGNVHF